MVDLIHHRPRFAVEDAERLTAARYGLVVAATPLPSDRDQNFLLQASGGANFVLKIANGSEPREVLEFQNGVLTHLSKNAELSPYFPQLLPDVDGATIGTVDTAGGTNFSYRLVTYLPGVPLATVNPQTPALRRELGRLLAQTDKALQSFSHPAMHRYLHWDLQHAAEVVAAHQDEIEGDRHRALVAAFARRHTAEVLPHLQTLRRSLIHADANDYNVLVSADVHRPRYVVGLIDFGDMVYSCTVFEVAVAAAYVMLDKPDPLAAAAELVSGYNEFLTLTDLELELLPVLIAMRLCTSVAVCAHQQQLEPDNTYLRISERPAWALLERLADVSPRLFTCILREACGRRPYPGADDLRAWLREHQGDVAPVLPLDMRNAPALVFDWSVGSLDIPNPEIAADPARFTAAVETALRESGAAFGVGRYDEARLVYAGDGFATDHGERRTVHIGLDLFMPAGTPVSAPLAGTVHSFADNDAPLDYGPTVILAHNPVPGLTFYTLYGHLSRRSLDRLEVGQQMAAGERIGWIGDHIENGGWPPHLHLQLIGDLLDRAGEFPGVAAPGRRAVWCSLCPDPNLLLGLPETAFPPQPLSGATIRAQRKEMLGPSLSLSYQEPLYIVRGWKQYLYDSEGRAYLDVVNNVCHVGHGHPRVVAAQSRQAAVLNTNTRYLHENIVRYAERLTATLPDPLSVCFFVCSGSEANELALRLARAHTGAEDFVVVDGAYHGNTAALIEISPYKHDGPGGRGTPPHVHKVAMPDVYRGRYRGPAADNGRLYAADVREAAERLSAAGRPLAGFITESLLGCGGQIVLPDSYLQHAFRHVRDAGGVCIVDEVQVGFGRVGSHFWGFATQGVVPDIVTMGKPIGNGHPLAAVVTTPEIAASFANGMEYFNTFGGNPVSCAVGLAVLDVIEEEQLQQHAWRVGERLLRGLRNLQEKHPLIGDVRGLGLFIGVELVKDRVTRKAAAAEADYVIQRMRQEGILLSTDGPLHNVLKLKPPLVFDEADADRLVATLDMVLAEDPLRR